MVKGRKKIAIFGFCDIKDFSIVNESLQERTMSFVNQIANIVHTSVDKFKGAVNKNIGDAFFCVWKFSKKKENISENSQNIELNLNNYNDYKYSNEEILINQAADCALLGYLNIILWINKKKNILIYKTDKDILNKIPGYKVKMGFGLNIGWAIEGAIGSNHKIDASYLSPNVNMSSRLEAATKQYGVNILISGDFYQLLSSELKEICRMVDIVTLKGSCIPIKLYTVDLNTNLTPSPNDQPNINLSENRKLYEEKKEKLYREIKITGSSIGNYIKNKNSFKEMFRLKRSMKFNNIFNCALENYILGEWENARKYFNECFEIDANDGPCKILYDYIKGFNFISPVTWKGYRELSSK